MASIPTRKPSRVFIDSSVLIAAAISPKETARELLLQGFRGQFELCTSSLVLLETERNLVIKAPLALPAFATFREVLVARIIDAPESLVRTAGDVVALKDAPIVAACAAAQASYLATYDRRHLLDRNAEIRARFSVETAVPEQILSECRSR